MWGLIKRRRGEAASYERIAELISMRARDPRPLTDQDYINEASRLRIPPENLRALAAFEGRAGFDKTGRLIIAYETHVFSRNTTPRHRFDRSHPRLSTRNWVNVRRLPRDAFHPMRLSNEERWALLAEAMELEGDAALKAASYGRYQILGEGAPELGFAGAEEMVRHLYQGEMAHLDLAIRFMRSRDILDDVRSANWERVIRRWNGDGQVAWATAQVRKYQRQYASLYGSNRRASA